MEKNISRSLVLNKVLTALHRGGVDYVVVGAAALVAHGLPRTTLDLDLYVPARHEVLVHLFHILDKLKLKSEQSAVLTMAHRPHLFEDQWICFSFGGEDILDIYLAREGHFEILRKGSVIKRNKGLKIRVASLEDLEAMKRSAGRPVDKADLELIREAKRLKRSKVLSSRRRPA